MASGSKSPSTARREVVEEEVVVVVVDVMEEVNLCDDTAVVGNAVAKAWLFVIMDDLLL